MNEHTTRQPMYFQTGDAEMQFLVLTSAHTAIFCVDKVLQYRKDGIDKSFSNLEIAEYVLPHVKFLEGAIKPDKDFQTILLRFVTTAAQTLMKEPADVRLELYLMAKLMLASAFRREECIEDMKERTGLRH